MLIAIIICYTYGLTCLISSPWTEPKEAIPTMIGYGITFTIIATILTIIKIRKNNKEKKQTIEYNSNKTDWYDLKTRKQQRFIKKQFITNCEMEYGMAIKKAIPENYILRPQICLASIIEKIDGSKYANELFRIIDFGIFDKNNNILLLIEINDNSHQQHHRIARDIKVKEICTEANIPLITFWTKYGIDEQYIERRIKECLEDLHAA